MEANLLEFSIDRADIFWIGREGWGPFMECYGAVIGLSQGIGRALIEYDM